MDRLDSEQRLTGIDLFEKMGICVHGDSVEEILARAVEFAADLVNCDDCSTYVREGKGMTPRGLKRSPAASGPRPKPPNDKDLAVHLTEHRAPIAVSWDERGKTKAKPFSEWSTDPGETFVSVPLLSQLQLMGAINLRHSRPRAYSQGEVSVLFRVGYLLGANVRISQLERENSDLTQRLETRKIIERGKGILQRDLRLTEEQAYLTLQRRSRQMRKPMKEIAQAIILSSEIRENGGQS